MFLSLATHGADQMMAQRYLAARTQREAALAVGLSGFVVIGQFLFFLLLGVGLGLWKQQNLPDVDLNADQIFAKFMVLGLPSGLTGLALAGVAAAAMSTLSSSLNSSATTFLADWLGYNDHEKEKPQQMPRLSRWLTAVFGSIQMCVALFAGWCFTPNSSVVTGVMAVASYTTGLLLGLLVLCFYPRQLSSRSVMAAFLVGLIAMTLIRFFTDIAWPWHALLGTAFVAVFGLLFSAFFHGRSPLGRSSKGTNL